MNLGDIYLKAFLSIVAIAFVMAFCISVGIRMWRRIHGGWSFVLVFVLGTIFTVVGNSLFHRRLFVRWQQSQNQWVPQTGCLTYEPSFGHLYATYSMNQVEFENWAAAYPVTLFPVEFDPDQVLSQFDSQRLGFGTPELAYSSESAPNGKQLRVYFKEDVMYLSYNVM